MIIVVHVYLYSHLSPGNLLICMVDFGKAGACRRIKWVIGSCLSLSLSPVVKGALSGVMGQGEVFSLCA